MTREEEDARHFCTLLETFIRIVAADQQAQGFGYSELSAPRVAMVREKFVKFLTEKGERK